MTHFTSQSVSKAFSRSFESQSAIHDFLSAVIEPTPQTVGPAAREGPGVRRWEAELQSDHDGQGAKVRNHTLHLMPRDWHSLLPQHNLAHPASHPPLSKADIGAQSPKSKFTIFLWPSFFHEEFSILYSYFIEQAMKFWRGHLAECR